MDFTFRNMLGPAAWAAMAAVPLAIFALYFLKLRRVPLEVPSTYLWLRVIEDLHVNSLWQRLRRSLLLFLQLLVVALAILALLRPGWQGGRLAGQKFVFLIDNSASMASTDAEGSSNAEGATRLEKAKQTIQTEIDKMESDMSAMVVSFSDRPNVVQEFTDKQRLLREAVQRVEPTASPTSIRGALELASSFANPGAVTIEVGGRDFAVEQEEVQLYILSDGRFGPVDGFSLGNLRPKYLPIGSAQSQNLAITALNTRSSDARPDERYAFVQIANFSEEVQTVTVYLTLDGDLVDAAEVEAPPGESQSYTFRMGLVTAGKLQATVEPPPGFQGRAAGSTMSPMRSSKSVGMPEPCW